ncbi:hypothetical protein [Nonomuraea lactucae]|uniref:hypothetical protein n=1 Tax=Nonomuraea lactucae TaxID=2249762 RepID=UPI000DE3518A|nr:hypothetical protein [Nonomuraea lactucae]
MAGTSATIDLGDRRLGKLLVRLGLCLLAGVGLAVFAEGPTWRGVGLAGVHVVAGFLIGLPAGRYFVRSGEPPQRMTPVIVINVALQEVLRLGLVTWSGAGAVEAAWIGLWTWIPVLIFGVLRLLRAGTAPETGPGESPARALGPETVVVGAGAIAREVALWLLVAWSPVLTLLTFAVEAGAGLLEYATARRQWLQAAVGYLLMALALTLWLT